MSLKDECPSLDEIEFRDVYFRFKPDASEDEYERDLAEARADREKHEKRRALQ